MGAALSAPLINDVSTDVDDPPQFMQSQHQTQLPDGFKAAIAKHYRLSPLVVPDGDPPAVFAAVVKAAGALPRASIVRQDAAAGELELLDVTALMRYKDDVAVRVRRAGGGVVVDVRSASRLGKGDLGCNAARIGAYLAALRRELGLGDADAKL